MMTYITLWKVKVERSDNPFKSTMTAKGLSVPSEFQTEESGQEIGPGVAMETQEPPTVWGSSCSEVSGLTAETWGVSTSAKAATR